MGSLLHIKAWSVVRNVYLHMQKFQVTEDRSYQSRGINSVSPPRPCGGFSTVFSLDGWGIQAQHLAQQWADSAGIHYKPFSLRCPSASFQLHPSSCQCCVCARVCVRVSSLGMHQNFFGTPLWLVSEMHFHTKPQWTLKCLKNALKCTPPETNHLEVKEFGSHRQHTKSSLKGHTSIPEKRLRRCCFGLFHTMTL